MREVDSSGSTAGYGGRVALARPFGPVGLLFGLFVGRCNGLGGFDGFGSLVGRRVGFFIGLFIDLFDRLFEVGPVNIRLDFRSDVLCGRTFGRLPGVVLDVLFGFVVGDRALCSVLRHGEWVPSFRVLSSVRRIVR